LFGKIKTLLKNINVISKVARIRSEETLSFAKRRDKQEGTSNKSEDKSQCGEKTRDETTGCSKTGHKWKLNSSFTSSEAQQPWAHIRGS
jgi:hypothetical protein